MVLVISPDTFSMYMYYDEFLSMFSFKIPFLLSENTEKIGAWGNLFQRRLITFNYHLLYLLSIQT